MAIHGARARRDPAGQPGSREHTSCTLMTNLLHVPAQRRRVAHVSPRRVADVTRIVPAPRERAGTRVTR